LQQPDGSESLLRGLRMDGVKLGTRVYVYLAVVAVCVLANFLLWRYRLHLYNLNTDYELEPLQSIQMILFRGTQAIIVAGLARRAWWKFSKKN
jgi:hypothetical protein